MYFTTAKLMFSLIYPWMLMSLNHPFRGSLGEDRLKHLHVMNCNHLTHWGRVTHICEQTIIGSDNGLSPGRSQAIIWTNTAILSTGSMGTNFSEILIEIYTFSFKKNAGWKMTTLLPRPQWVKMMSAKSHRPNMNYRFICGVNNLKCLQFG